MPGYVAESSTGSPPARPTAAYRGLSLGQWSFWATLPALAVLGLIQAPDLLALISFTLVQTAFLAVGLWRLTLATTGLRRPAAPASVPAPDLPRYTILAALHDEAEVVPQLIRRLAAIDYPPDRLQAMLLLETDDAPTIAAALTTPRPDWLEVVIVPDGRPRTKPRALNHGLARATGDLVTIYDAEDQPHPGQLREVAARFAADVEEQVGCIQSPLRIRPVDHADLGGRLLGRQFAVEYAALFEVTLPAMAQLGLPFPLGGTSNHFRIEALRQAGGWDAWNVTEDADLGLALWRDGWRLDVARLPTLETAPRRLHDWLPQRTRWLKGFLQTWGVHTRDPRGLGWRGNLALVMTIGAPLVSAACHAGSLAVIAVLVMVALLAGLPPAAPVAALGVMSLGLVTAWINGAIGARRAGVRFGLFEIATSPVVWALLSLALAHAAWRLLREPFAWDKTAHEPDRIEVEAQIDADDPLLEIDKALRFGTVSH